MLAGENIICFGRDWGGDAPGDDDHHVMRLLARRNHVLWLNCVAGSGGTLGRTLRKVRDLARGPAQIAGTLWVYTPAFIPMPPPERKIAFNRRLLQSTLTLVRRRLGMASYHLWTFTPTALPYLGMPGERLVVYYCEEDWPQAARLARLAPAECERIEQLEQETCRRADLVFTATEALWHRRRSFNPETHFVGASTRSWPASVEEIERRVRAVARRRSGKTQERPIVVDAPAAPAPVAARPGFATVMPGHSLTRLV
jgi:hypothetical protein